MKKILIITGGPVSKLDDFAEASKNLEIELTTASFSDVNFKSYGGFSVKIKGEDISSFDLIYFRLVGKRIEDATIVANYARQKGTKVIDKVYTSELLYPSTISKAHETMKLIQNNIPMPKTIYGGLKYLKEIGPKEFGYPFVIKSTTGKKAREVWAPKNEEDLEEICKDIVNLEKKGSRFFAQEFLRASQRYRVFILGGKAVACVTQPTKWRKRFLEKVDGEFPEGERGFINPIPSQVSSIAEQAVKAVDLDISGVDVMQVDSTNELYIIEANAGPSWKLIKKHTNLNVEEEIIKWLIKQI